MNKQEAITILEQVVKQLHKQGTVQVTPEAYEQIANALTALSEGTKIK